MSTTYKIVKIRNIKKSNGTIRVYRYMNNEYCIIIIPPEYEELNIGHFLDFEEFMPNYKKLRKEKKMSWGDGIEVRQCAYYPHIADPKHFIRYEGLTDIDNFNYKLYPKINGNCRIQLCSKTHTFKYVQFSLWDYYHENDVVTYQSIWTYSHYITFKVFEDEPIRTITDEELYRIVRQYIKDNKLLYTYHNMTFWSINDEIVITKKYVQGYVDMCREKNLYGYKYDTLSLLEMDD